MERDGLVGDRGGCKSETCLGRGRGETADVKSLQTAK
jgi:hypothetical protein